MLKEVSVSGFVFIIGNDLEKKENHRKLLSKKIVCDSFPTVLLNLVSHTLLENYLQKRSPRFIFFEGTPVMG